MWPVFLYTVISYFPILTKITTIFEEVNTGLTVFKMVNDCRRYSKFLTGMFTKKLTSEEIELELVSDWVMLVQPESPTFSCSFPDELPV